jgi:hypothetical protein
MGNSRVERARELQDRTKKFALRIIRAFARLPNSEETRVLGRHEPLRPAAAAGASTPRLEELYAELKAFDLAPRDELAAATTNS